MTNAVPSNPISNTYNPVPDKVQTTTPLFSTSNPIAGPHSITDASIADAV